MTVCQPAVPPLPRGASLAGKTVIITGGSSGMGFEAARQFLIIGAARVIITCRSLSRGKEAITALRADAQVALINPRATIEAFELELSDYQSGYRFVKTVRAKVAELDILLNNGGQSRVSYKKAVSGHEENMQGHYTLSTLIPRKKKPG